VETCENCGAAIGKLETAHVFNNNVVCTTCLNKLRNTATFASAAGAGASASSPARRVQTVQRTGKLWKSIQLFSVLSILTGATMLIIGIQGGNTSLSMASFAPLLIGIPAYIVGRFGAWWFHG